MRGRWWCSHYKRIRNYESLQRTCEAENKEVLFSLFEKLQQNEKIIKSYVGEHLCLPLAEETRLIMCEEKSRRATPGAAVRQNDSLYPY